MTKKGLTEVVFILDKSGSMSGLEEDTIGGFNSFIEKQKQLPGESRITLVLFNDQYHILYSGVRVELMPTLNATHYSVEGMTAMLDAIGRTINEVGSRLAKWDEDDRPENVIFVITTDGKDNSSKEYSIDTVRNMVHHQTEKYNWKFIFLGANINSAEVGGNLGINHTSNYSASSAGTQSVYRAAFAASESVVMKGDIDDEWKKEVE